jgi:hypothetical protein
MGRMRTPVSNFDFGRYRGQLGTLTIRSSVDATEEVYHPTGVLQRNPLGVHGNLGPGVVRQIGVSYIKRISFYLKEARNLGFRAAE